MTSAEQIASGQFSSSLLIGLGLKLGFVLALIYLSLYLLKRYGLERKLSLPLLRQGQNFSEQTIEVKAVQALNRQSSLYLIEVNHREILLSVTLTGETQILTEWPSSQEPPQNPIQTSNHEQETI